jgi:hypothetical protein
MLAEGIAEKTLRVSDIELRCDVQFAAAQSVTYDSTLRLRILCWPVIGALGLVPLAPAEHVHEMERNGHYEAVLRQHARPHAMVQIPSDAGRAYDHLDEPILTLSTVYTAPARQAPVVPVLPVIAVLEPLQLAVAAAFSGVVELLIHGPPSALPGLRAPPVRLA